MLLHNLVLVDHIPPVRVRICHIVVVTGLSTSPWVFLCLQPLVYHTLGELGHSADIRTGLVVESHVRSHIRHCMDDLERFVIRKSQVIADFSLAVGR